MKVLIVPVIAWAISQGLKQVFHLMGRNRRVFSGDTNPKILLSGGMPSAHSAIVVSLAVFLGLQDGWDSSVFGLATWLAIIVMYDAMMVRYSSGMQGETLNKLISEQGSKLKKTSHCSWSHPCRSGGWSGYWCGCSCRCIFRNKIIVKIY